MNLTSFLQDKHLTVALRGEIDHHSAKDIMRVLGNKIDLYLPRVCVLDFREVTFMDSSGIAHRDLLRAPDAAAARRGHSPKRSAAADEGAQGLRH